jgi:tetratricopeptide (TPR) repeat protein
VLLSFIIALSINTAALFKDLSELRELDKSQPDKALAFYKSRLADYPNDPSQGLFEIHKIGFRAALIMNDHDTVALIAELFQSPPWQELVKAELPFMVSNFGIYYKRNALDQQAENTFMCAKRLATDPKFLSTIDNNLAALYLETNQVDKARKTLIYALKHHQGDDEDKQSIHANLGSIYYLEGEYRKAIEQFKEPFVYFVRANDKESAVRIGLNLLVAAVEAEDFDTYQRFQHKVAEQVMLSKEEDLTHYLQWIQVYYRYLDVKVKPDSAIQSALIKSMPRMTQMQITDVVDRIVAALDLSTITAAWRAQPNRQLESTAEENHTATIKPIALSWCDGTP